MLQIYDSLSRSKRPFKPVRQGEVSMYVCGMTVYDYCHLGHARMLVGFDVIARWLRASGYKLNYVRNITDVDDKIIRRAVESNQKISEVTRFFIDAMHADERALNVLPPDQEPRATAYVPHMLEIIAELQKKGLAYQAKDGDVNFAVRQFPGYGKLSGKSLDQLRAGERVAVSDAKRDPLDFVLWKAAKPEEPQESKWDSTYGAGRPGWHIECSAMSHAVLGLPLDIHGGGPDLKFPHHENEIAQSEGAFGQALANTWMHCGPLMVDAEKMSKSLGNFRTIRQTIDGEPDKGHAQYSPNVREAEMLRFFIVRNHYRSAQNYTPDNLADAQAALDRLYMTLQSIPAAQVTVDWQAAWTRDFKAAMDDDFNTASAIAVLFELSGLANRSQDPQVSGQLLALGKVLGLFTVEPTDYFKQPTRYTHRAIKAVEAVKAVKATQSPAAAELVAAELSDEEIETKVQARVKAKQSKDFKLADQIREELAAAGVLLEDKPGGLTQWRRG
ncbi:cysteine--tRNA ligase [Orrella daihaiensis]|uniref:Cysteine--tRNA ligase n=1 Tax=Orrella daihaiensis TaxID=2782176 RepID=A0ABY4ALL9_9BURK|nr:cysteine--tRNA ligase [Orrella daihaiensis]UOD51178.1 cysteine--tRNA ligase [Orrella daihaiensis]